MTGQGYLTRFIFIIWIILNLGCRATTNSSTRIAAESPTSVASPQGTTPVPDGSGTCLTTCGGEPIDGEVLPKLGTKLQMNIPTWACNSPELQVVADFNDQISFFNPCVNKQISLNPPDDSVRIRGSSLFLIGNYVFRGAISSDYWRPSTNPRASCSVPSLLVDNTIVEGFSLFYTSPTEYWGVIHFQEFDPDIDMIGRYGVQRISPIVSENEVGTLSIETPGLMIKINKTHPKEDSVLINKFTGEQQTIRCGINY